MEDNKIAMDNLKYDEVINLTNLFNFFKRNKKIIGLSGILFIILSFFYSSIQKKVWEGQFEIVLAKNDNTFEDKNFLNSQNIISLISNSGMESLSTEVGILKSPSVLKSVFDIVNKKHLRDNPKANDLIFEDWRENNLEIELQKGTSILRIAYRDSDKEIILPVLEKMTNEYQKYSGKRERRKIDLAKNYLISQIEVFRKKSLESLKAAQDYAIDQDLTVLEDINKNNINNNFGPQNNLGSNNVMSFLNNYKSVTNGNENILNISIENQRINAANKIKKIDSQIKIIKNLENKDEIVSYLNLILPEALLSSKEGIYELQKVIAENKSKYTEKDKTLIKLEKTYQMMIENIRVSAIAYLKALRLETQTKVELVSRPKEVLIKYKELLRDLASDEETLIQLERQLRYIDLEELRSSDPWELITQPTLVTKPVSPKPISFALIGLLFGLTLGSFLAYQREKENGKIYDTNLLVSKLQLPILDIISFEKNDDLTKAKLTNLFDILNSFEKSRIFNLSSMDQKYIKKLFSKNLTLDYELKFVDKLSEIKDDEKIILLTEIDSLTINALDDFKNSLNFMDKKLHSILIVNF